MRSIIGLFNCFLMLCACAFFFSSCSSNKTIVNALDEKEANEIIVFLSGKGIDAFKTAAPSAGGGGSHEIMWDIQVDSQQALEAMSLLNQAGLPRRRGQNLLGIFSAGGLVPSELQEQIRYQAGLAEQIASTIRKIDGVLDAEVQISFPKEDPLNPGKSKQKITASVYVKHNGVLDDPNSHLTTKIKRLVAASITGLDYDDVTVISDRARNNDFTGTNQGVATDEEKQFVSVWTLILAKDSVNRFRIVFFSFIFTILLLTIALVWLLWKIIPVLNRHGGIKELFHVHPIDIDKQAETAEKKSEDSEPKPPEDEEKMDETT